MQKIASRALYEESKRDRNRLNHQSFSHSDYLSWAIFFVSLILFVLFGNMFLCLWWQEKITFLKKERENDQFGPFFQ